MDNHTNLVKIYLFICDNWDNNLKYISQRFSNNSNPEFTDQEILTIMIYSITYERRFKINEIYNFADNYLRDWFPMLKSYVAFDKRVNRLANTFNALYNLISEQHSPENSSDTIRIVDSMPIITCSGKRTPKVATEIVDKSYCASKSLYYHGVKLHLLSSQVKGTLPRPESVIITPASENDLNVFRDNWSKIPNVSVFADKIYLDKQMQKDMMKIDSELLAPVKYNKGASQVIKQMCAAADKLYSFAVSQIRQPIESFFNWIIEKTDIQRASKVRSTKGLMVHIFAKLSAAMITKLNLNC